MKAALVHAYGSADELRVEDVPKPEPGPRDARVRVCASSVNPVDWKLRSGGQRNIVRYRLPWILGLDVSGVVDAVGAEVTRFKVGDEVWSSPRHTRPGAYAEYMCVDERELAKKPKKLTHDEAATLPLVALTAYQCLFDKGKLERGQTVLVQAGSGGVGAAAIQLAKHAGARVVTTCSGKNAELVTKLGADQVIDYTKERFDDVLSNVDLVLDSIGEPVFAGNLKVLRRGGRMSNISVDVPGFVERYGATLSLFPLAAWMIWMHVYPLVAKGIHVRHVIKRCDGEQLARIAELVDEGALAPTVEKVFALDDIAAAHRMSETGRVRGKIAVHVADP
jgi:NADPH:quinone reductase-like Zn-dependent oxidoreductase